MGSPDRHHGEAGFEDHRVVAVADDGTEVVEPIAESGVHVKLPPVEESPFINNHVTAYAGETQARYEEIHNRLRILGADDPDVTSQEIDALRAQLREPEMEQAFQERIEQSRADLRRTNEVFNPHRNRGRIEQVLRALPPVEEKQSA